MEGICSHAAHLKLHRIVGVTILYSVSGTASDWLAGGPKLIFVNHTVVYR
jgi:hypothetical protein